MTDLKSHWSIVESWWGLHVQGQQRGLLQLRDRLDQLNRLWEQSDCTFDCDPLTTDWMETSPLDGPLRTNQEENWSQWLAHLLRDSVGAYSSELFASKFDMMPTHVCCERAYHDEELHDRRVDIIAEFGDIGITIEVKIEDEHYEKTPQTAYLTEKHHQRDLNWAHYLLLPQSKRDALRDAFGDQLRKEEARPTITPTTSEEQHVSVIYWSEVAQALRKTLLTDAEPSTHWIASAYLFTTLIEEQILEFYALPALDDYRTMSLGVSDVERLQSIEPDDQVTYLDEQLEEVNHG